MYIYRGKLKLSDDNNEGITLMFPSQFSLGDRVHVCLGSYIDTSAIDRTTSSSSIESVHFQFGNSISLDVTFSDGIEKLSVRFEVKIPYNDTYIDLICWGNLDLVDTTYPLPIAFPSSPRVYMGTLTNWGKYAVDEPFIIVAPGSMDAGNRICAFWQWTEVDSGAKKVNVDCISTIDKVTWISGVGESFRFYMGADYYYTFDVTVYESDDKLTYTMKNPREESTGVLTLLLKNLEPTSNARRKRDISAVTKVYNDSDKIVVCSLTSGGTPIFDKLLAMTGLNATQAGLLAAIPTTLTGLPAAVGYWATAIGTAIAVAGAAQVFSTSSDEVSATMFPGDEIKRTVTGFPLLANNSLHILLYKLSNNTISVITATVGNQRGEFIKLNDYLPGGSKAPTYQELLPLTIHVDNPHLVYYRIYVIPGLKVSGHAKSLNTMKESDISNALSTMRSGEAKPNWYGTIDNLYGQAMNDYNIEEWDYILFEFDTEYKLTLTRGVNVNIGSFATMHRITSEEGNGMDTFILILYHAILDSGRRFLRKCRSTGEMLDIVKQNASYSTFTYEKDNSVSAGFTTDKKTRIGFSVHKYNRVVLRVDSVRPFQSLLSGGGD